MPKLGYRVRLSFRPSYFTGQAHEVSVVYIASHFHIYVSSVLAYVFSVLAYVREEGGSRS